MSEGKIIEIYNKGLSEIIDVIKNLSNQIKEQNARIDALTSLVKYGENIKSVGVYLTQYQLIPYKRGCELIYDLFGVSLSEGTMVNFT